MERLEQIDKSIQTTICKLERVFLPSFFDVMIHLAIHLAKEAKVAGPIQFLWMYYIERYLRTLKEYICNNAYPEGSIAEGYLAEECMTICSRYLTDMETKQNRPDRKFDSSNIDPKGSSTFNCRGKSLAGSDWDKLSNLEINQAHFYILQNCEEVRPWIEEHLEMLLKKNTRNVAKRHKEEFPLWFEEKYIMMTDVQVSNNIEPADATSDPQQGQTKKGRGKTKGFSILKKRKVSNNGKLKVIIPSDRTVAVGPGANDFVTEISVKVSQHAEHDVKKWKEVLDLVKDRIVAHILDTFNLPSIQHNRDTILETAKKLYRYSRSRHHKHFKKFATKEESLQNMPEELDEAEWKFLVEYFSSDSFKKMSERNKINKSKQETKHICGRKSFQAVSFAVKDVNNGKEPNLQKLWEMTHMKNGHWVDDASAKLTDKVKEFVDEKIQEIEEGVDVDPIVNDAFVKIVGEKSGYCRGQGSGVKPSIRKSMSVLQEQLQAQQKERENVECKLMEVQNQLEEKKIEQAWKLV